jgi:FkbM family methyltransferase
MLRDAVKALDRRLGTEVWEGVVAGVRVAQHLAVGRDRARVAFAGLRFGLGSRRPVTFSLPVGDRRVPFTVPDWAAMAVVVEVFVSTHYDEPAGAAPAAVLDLGGHIGAAALFFRGRYPEARIVSVEASPQLVDLLRRNTAGLGIEVVHAAVAGSAGTATFRAAPESWGGSIGAGDGSSIEVPAVTLDHLLAEHAIDAVKMDVEGAEFEVVAAARRLDAATTYWGEVHATADDERTQRMLAAFGGFAVDVRADGDVTLFTAVSSRSAQRE